MVAFWAQSVILLEANNVQRDITIILVVVELFLGILVLIPQWIKTFDRIIQFKKKGWNSIFLPYTMQRTLIFQFGHL
jgi:hypothetical protein